jgi:cytoskeletal protein RodZ
MPANAMEVEPGCKTRNSDVPLGGACVKLPPIRKGGAISKIAKRAKNPLNKEEMSTVAEQLRSAREAKQLTIEQVAELTKIRTDRVRALEAGQFDAFSATIYIRGSVKNYAKLLKLDEGKLLAALDVELKGTEKFSEPPPLMETKKSFIDTLTLLGAKLNWKIGFAGIAVIAFIVLGGAGVWAWRHHRTSDPTRNMPPAVSQSANPGDTLPLPKK